MVCNKCGTHNDEGTSMCYQCGQPLSAQLTRSQQGRQSQYGQPSKSGQQSLYSQQPQYGQKSQYAQQPWYGQQSQYAQQPRYGQQSQYAQRPQYGQQSQYTQQPRYGQQSQYAQQPRDGQQSQYTQQPRYGQQSQYAQQSQYGQQSQYAQQPQYGRPSSHGQQTNEQFYGQTPEKSPGENAATMSYIFGILAWFVCGLVFGILAIVQSKKAKSYGVTGGKARFGFVVGLISFVIQFLGIIALIIYLPQM